MADTGEFQFNDIVLSIPPEQIITSRDSLNKFWSTLRTRSSIKAKSGFSNLSIVLAKIAFTDTFDPATGMTGYDKLRNIVSQIRVTPFAHIEDEYLRTTLLGGDRVQTMVFAVHSVEIYKGADDSNVIYSNFHL